MEDLNDNIREFMVGPHSDSESETESDSDDDELGDRTNDWNQTFCPNVNSYINPTSKLKPEVLADEKTTPFELLKIYITSEMIENICSESCRYAEQVKADKPTSFSKWTPITESELWTFLALNMAMGINWRPSLKDYWSTNELLSSPIYSKTMSRNRFEDILRSLHFVDNSTVPANNKDKYIKLGSFMDILIKNLKSVANPGEFLCLDESLIPFKGRVSIRQYNPKKRGRFGLKFFVLVDCDSHLTLDLLPYQGKATKIDKTHVKDMGFGGAAVLTMLKPYFLKNHKVVIDNYFNSPALGLELINKGTHILGTAQRRRKMMPKMTTKLKKGEAETCSNGKLLVERWRDRREVYMLNSFATHEMKPAPSKRQGSVINKPQSVLIYNQKMGGVDEMDKCIRPYSNDRRTCKWYKKVFFYLVDVAIYNAYKLFSMFHVTQTYKDFVLAIIREIFEKHPLVRSLKGRPAAIPKSTLRDELHMPVKVKKLNGKTSLSDCVICKKQGLRRQTSFKCEKCNKRLCISDGNNCFKKYHENKARNVNNATPVVMNRGVVESQLSSYQSYQHSAFIDQEPSLGIQHAASDKQHTDTDTNSILAPPTPCSSVFYPESPIPCSTSFLSTTVSPPSSSDENSNSISLLNELYMFD